MSEFSRADLRIVPEELIELKIYAGLGHRLAMWRYSMLVHPRIRAKTCVNAEERIIRSD